jgi:serine/threonine protein kinase
MTQVKGSLSTDRRRGFAKKRTNPMPRQIKDEYEILSEIGAGGMAVVYKALQKSLDRMVAIKELKKSYHGDAQIVKRFERESRVAASLQHENIVHIYDYWKKPNYAIVMEYVDGTTLADVIEKTGALPIDVGIMIAIQVSSALDYAHMRGLVHRDIKPGNIMIKRNGEVKLMDFGIAHTRNLEALTLPGTLIGTPSYMSPEQILGQELDVRSDIFSFGIVLYEMFAGTKPFTDDDTRAVTAKIMKDSFHSPRSVNSEIPWRLQWLIKKCLRKKAKRRYGSMLEVEKKLGRRLAGRTTKAGSLQRIAAYLVSMNVFEAAPEQETMIVTTKVPLMSRFRTAVLSLALFLFLAGGAAAYYVWMKSKDTPAQYPAIQPVLPSTATSLITQPQQTTPTVPGAARQDSAISSLSTTRSAPSVSAVSSSISTTRPASAPTSVSAQQTKKETTTPGKKTKKSKKKKKVTSEQ